MAPGTPPGPRLPTHRAPGHISSGNTFRPTAHSDSSPRTRSVGFLAMTETIKCLWYADYIIIYLWSSLWSQ